MIKKIIIITFAMITAVCLNSCDDKDKFGGYLISTEMEYKVSPGEDFRVYYDLETKVMYFMRGSRLSPILNSDGTPKLYESNNK